MAQQTIIAHFDSRSQAEIAQTALVTEGLATSAIRMLPDQGSSYTRSSSETAYDHGQDRGGFWASLGNLALPDEDRYTYAEGMSRGGVTLAVTTDDAHYDRVAAILEHNGAVDLDAREAEWRSTGWTGYTAAASTGTTPAGTTAAAGTLQDDGVIQVVEEQIQVGKRQVDRGSVRIRSFVVEVPVEADVELRQERVEVVRRPVNRPATAEDLQSANRTLEAHERHEEAVVSKQARVVEEIGLRQEAHVEHQVVQDTVRKTEVEIEDERMADERLRGTRPLNN